MHFIVLITILAVATALYILSWHLANWYIRKCSQVTTKVYIVMYMKATLKVIIVILYINYSILRFIRKLLSVYNIYSIW